MKANIAILLATYNGEKFLREQLDSLLAQTYQNWTCYIHDDGSTDSTVKIITEYADNSDKFIVLDYPPQGGAKENFFSMVRKVDAPYIMFCDQDDVWLPIKIEKTLSKMIETEQQTNNESGISIPVCVFTDSTVVDSALRMIKQSFVKDILKCDPFNRSFNRFFFNNCAPGCTMMINDALADYVCRIESHFSFFVHDHFFALIAFSEGALSFIPESTMLYRQHSGNVIGAGVSKKPKLQNIPYRSAIRKVYHFIKYIVLGRKFNALRRYKDCADELLSSGVLRNQENIDFFEKS
ncbi:glycosyltransferase (rhamnosyltransferase),family 2 (GT2) [Synergistales bacterium]|nr:glycosyltransferase (rhamnosyltransferase),family 2 (GT2) [Synergistales bacterium]